jgi:hypothetical protein
MALLSTEDQTKFRLLHGHHFLASCDECQKLIKAGELYVVKEWRRRKDKLLFLGAIPTDVRCMTCVGVAQGTIKMVDGLVQPVKEKTKKEKVYKHDMKSQIRRDSPWRAANL